MLRSWTIGVSSLALVISTVSVSSASSSLSSKDVENLLQQVNNGENVPDVIVDTDSDPQREPTSSPSDQDNDNSRVEKEEDVTTQPGDRRFTCQRQNGDYTVMYHPSTQDESYPWAVPQQMGAEWSPQRRCNVISNRLEQYRPDGLLELKTDVKNNQDIVCVTTEANPSCRIVFTVPRDQDPIRTRDRVFDNLASANQGQATRGVTTFSGNSDLGELFGINGSDQSSSKGINLKPFLAPADGGTGKGLDDLKSNNSNHSGNSGKQLDPDIFR